MSVPFPSPEWASAFKDAINNNPEYRSVSADWTYGVVALVFKAEPPGLPADVGVWLDLDRGICRDARMVTVEEATKAPFCITGEYARWKQVLRRELEPIKGTTSPPFSRRATARMTARTRAHSLWAAKE